MRSPVVPFAAAWLCLLAGCSSTPTVDALKLPPPSHETTSAIVRPSAPVAEAGGPDIVPAAAPAEALAISDGPPVPMPEKAIAALVPPKPMARPALIPVQKIYGYGFRDAKPVSFGRKYSPRKLAVHGVDVSRWQGDIDWDRLRRQGANFAYIKATDGGDHVDPMFMKNWRGAAAAGLRRGAYHFFYWCRTAGEQADWFIRNVPRTEDALPPVIDVEWNHQSSCRRHPSRNTVLEKMQVFMDKLERHYGKRPIIYTTPDFYADNLEGAFRDHPFWLRSTAEHPAKVYPGRQWLFWQYSGSGLSHGVDGLIDLNVFNGDEGDWWRWLHGTRGGQEQVAAE